MYQHIISGIDVEISRLTAARALLSEVTAQAANGTSIGKPVRRNEVEAVTTKTGNPGLQKKRVVTLEARAKIAAAQKARWAASRKKGS